jgi:hypothetical protein
MKDAARETARHFFMAVRHRPKQSGFVGFSPCACGDVEMGIWAKVKWAGQVHFSAQHCAEMLQFSLRSNYYISTG